MCNLPARLTMQAYWVLVSQARCFLIIRFGQHALLIPVVVCMIEDHGEIRSKQCDSGLTRLIAVDS